jgi:SAM-dependent methyltransferase
MVAGFVRAPPNARLVEVARTELASRARPPRALDLGCGAGRNAVPLAALGWDVVGLDLSTPMLRAAQQRAEAEGLADRVHLGRAAMDRIPIADDAADFLVAHGIWNLARSGGEFRRAAADAARVARRGAALFVFTFSRNTFGADAEPVSGETFVFTQFSGQPQCFLTRDELVAELGAAGFTLDADAPLLEHNRRSGGSLRSTGVPVIHEGVFRYGR